MSRRHKFHSALPPEQIPGILAAERKTCDQRAKLEVCIKTRWKGRYFTVTRSTARRYTAADGWIPRVRGVGWTKGSRTDWQWNNPFCGQVRSDGQGGQRPARAVPHPSGGKAAVRGLCARDRIQFIVFIGPQCGDPGGGDHRGGAVSAPTCPRLQGH